MNIVLHGLLAGNGGGGAVTPTLQTLGTLIGHYRGDAPVSSMEQDGYNTTWVNNWGETVICRFFDFSGNGNHLTTDIYSSIYLVGGMANFTGGGYTDMVDIGAGSNYRTILVESEAMPTGCAFFTLGGCLVYLGDVTGAITGETISAVVNNSPTDYLATGATVPAGMKTITAVLSETDPAMSAFYLNGAKQALITGQKTANNLGTTFGYGRNSANSLNRPQGKLKQIIIYQEAFTDDGVMTLDQIRPE